MPPPHILQLKGKQNSSWKAVSQVNTFSGQHCTFQREHSKGEKSSVLQYSLGLQPGKIDTQPGNCWQGHTQYEFCAIVDRETKKYINCT